MEIKKEIFLQLLITVCATSLLSGCAGSGDKQDLRRHQVEDPFEGVNRAVFGFNEVVDTAVINPAVRGYRAAVPHPARAGVKNVLRNLKSPVRFTNQILQGDLSGAGNELFRTVVNTFVGAGGLFDVAGREGYAYEHEDFGQTLGVWGVPNGAYVVAPFLGPSSMRDYAGYAVDSFADPLNMYLRNTNQDGWFYGRLGVEYLTVRDGLYDVLTDLEASSIDYYAAIRSTYYQNREALIKDRDSSALAAPAIPDFDDESYDDQYFE